ncbi:unnamed protein product, partial [Ectocarpus sp. 13 AM-2016]
MTKSSRTCEFSASFCRIFNMYVSSCAPVTKQNNVNIALPRLFFQSLRVDSALEPQGGIVLFLKSQSCFRCAPRVHSFAVNDRTLENVTLSFYSAKIFWVITP